MRKVRLEKKMINTVIFWVIVEVVTKMILVPIGDDEYDDDEEKEEGDNDNA